MRRPYPPTDIRFTVSIGQTEESSIIFPQKDTLYYIYKRERVELRHLQINQTVYEERKEHFTNPVSNRAEYANIRNGLPQQDVAALLRREKNELTASNATHQSKEKQWDRFIL